MEIERKFLVTAIPSDLNVTKTREIKQGYLNTAPVVRIRKDNDLYELTYKSKGLMAREEYNMPLNKEAFEHLSTKIDGRMIIKTRKEIPITGPFGENLKIELDLFHGDLAPLVLAEVEFPSVESANAFVAPAWFGKDVTFDGKYHNSTMSFVK